jgi:hypothetical protein
VSDPDTADSAYELEQRVLAARQSERASWLPLASALASFHATQAWKDLGWEKFTDWLGDPEVGIGPRHAYRLIAVWSWAQDRAIPDEQLALCDVTKLAVAMAAFQRQPIVLEDLLSDVQALSRSDLIVKYGNEPTPRAARETEDCETCGRRVLVEVSSAEP